MTIISKLNYPSITGNPDITNIFDFDNFLAQTRLNGILYTASVLDYTKVEIFISNMTKNYQANAQSFLNNDKLVYVDPTDSTLGESSFLKTLFNTCYTTAFIPFLKTNASNIDPSNNNANKKTIAEEIIKIFEAPIDWSNMQTLGDQLKNLNDMYFSFGGCSSDKAFNVGVFKQRIVPGIISSFYPMIYYLHIIKQAKGCNDFKCRRAYILMKYVFVYYTLMTLFLKVFGSAENVELFKSVNTKYNNEKLTAMKYQLVLTMDGVLDVLTHENVLDLPDSNNFSSMTEYYNKLKELSDGNIHQSSELNGRKDTAVIMQNNLLNYTNNEVVTYTSYQRTKIAFIIIVVVLLLDLAFLLLLIFNRQYDLVFVIGGVSLLAIIIYGMVALYR
jgi:hypothetical protein